MARRISENKTWVEISKKALLSNARVFRKRLGRDVGLMAVVKSNAYGHGATLVAKTLQPQVDRFGVDGLDEALTLKKAGIKKPILVLGFTPSWRAKEGVRNGIRMTVSTEEQVRAVKAAAEAVRKDARIHLKIDTGTTRQGADIRGLPDIASLIRSSKRLVLEGLSTHFADIEDTRDHSYAQEQLERFEEAVRLLDAKGLDPEIRHAACTAAAMLFPETHFNMARVGIGMYGLWPSAETRLTADERGLDLEIDPVLSWKTVVAQVRDVRRGTPVSYGRTETTTRDGRIAVLPIGYWDGFGRGLSSIGEVLVRGKRAKVMGRVCMNMCMVDVTDVPGVKPEDEVTLIGEVGKAIVTADEVAAKLGTINYEVVTRINPLIPRVLV